MKRNPNLKLKALRLEHNLKQIDMAKLLGISENTYNRKENGITEFTESEIKKICDIFNKKAEEIFFRNDVTKNITKEVS
ncbi:helix-turn-helix transcriptional regulator [Caldanaerobacter subterraneus]|uniref:Helix-turn-helix transcriptional regulator n=1 Tax=Caldanaerobacter subterraneus TaxID=911092 RepID=A0A7Y2PM47_9THEO|nr:helix-turn-helix transcriptional regulator [Caldanaerobacter subterraneus]NNG67315.1 helix-turn-helix transcriptional regulator [Caldanaerobacter subterraneus]